MKILTIDELDQFARDFINGQVTPDRIWSLQLFDMWAVLTMAATYSCTKVGTMDGITCAKLKYVIFNRYEDFRTRTIFFEKMYETWIKNTKAFSGKQCELAKAINSKTTDLVYINELSLEIIDLLTKEDTYLKMFQQKCTDKAFMSHAMQTANRNIDYYIQQFGNKVPYARLLEKFYAATCEDKIADMFERLDPEKFRYKAKSVPVKSDDIKCIAESIKKTYGKVS